MTEQSWWQRAIAAINREYERRIRRASLVGDAAGDHHAAHTPADSGDAATMNDQGAATLDEGEAAEIVNLPKGAPLGRRPRSTADTNPE